MYIYLSVILCLCFLSFRTRTHYLEKRKNMCPIYNSTRVLLFSFNYGFYDNPFGNVSFILAQLRQDFENFLQLPPVQSKTQITFSKAKIHFHLSYWHSVVPFYTPFFNRFIYRGTYRPYPSVFIDNDF